MLANDQNLSNLSEIPASNDPFTIRILKKFPKQRDREEKEEHREGPCHFQGFRKFLSWSKKGRKNNRDDWSRGASNSRNEVSRFASGKARSKDLPRDLESRGGCTRARILWGCRCSTSARLYDRFIDRERETRKNTHRKKGERAKERNEFSPLSQGFDLVANRRKMFETGIGPRTRYRVAISCLSFPFI